MKAGDRRRAFFPARSFRIGGIPFQFRSVGWNRLERGLRLSQKRGVIGAEAPAEARNSDREIPTKRSVMERNDVRA
jgi:hypothetical protein